jgi:hypothetical protein
MTRDSDDGPVPGSFWRESTPLLLEIANEEVTRGNLGRGTRLREMAKELEVLADVFAAPHGRSGQNLPGRRRGATRLAGRGSMATGSQGRARWA